MRKARLIKNQKEKFILQLNKKIYKQRIIDKAVTEDDSIRKISSKGRYFQIELNTQYKREVLEWINYLLYLERSSFT